MRTKPEGVELIKSSEGFYPMAYLCPASIPTIGYGHTRGVKLGQNITKEEAEALLIQDIEEMERLVLSLVEVPLTDNQLSALVSFTFNEGFARLRDSTLLKRVNANDFIGAADEFLRWNKAGGRGTSRTGNPKKSREIVVLVLRVAES